MQTVQPSWSRWDSSDFAWKSRIPTNIALQTEAKFSLCELAWEIRRMDLRPSIRLPRVCDYLYLFSVHDQLVDQLIVPTNAKLTLYKSAILPYLTYCHLTWHFCSATDKRKLERVQERALRAVFLDKQSSYQALLDKSDLTTLQNRRLQDIAILMYKVKHKLCPIKISELFHAHCSPYNLRTAEFAIPRFRTNKYGKHSLTYLGPKLWNKLPSEIRTLPSLFSFKNCIRKFDLGVMIDDDNCSNCILCNS